MYGNKCFFTFLIPVFSFLGFIKSVFILLSIFQCPNIDALVSFYYSCEFIPLKKCLFCYFIEFQKRAEVKVCAQPPFLTPNHNVLNYTPKLPPKWLEHFIVLAAQHEIIHLPIPLPTFHIF